MKREVIIVGGGVAGIQTALRLADRGIRPTIVEKEPDLGGKLRGWYHLFPSLTPASEVLSELRRRLAARDVEVMTSAEAVSITPGSRRNTATGFMTMFSLRPTSSGCSTKGM